MREYLILGAGFAAGVVAALLAVFFYRLGATPATPTGPGKVDLSVVSGQQYRLSHVVDGDTIVLENGLHVRYAGINTPELGRFVKDAAPLAREATARNRELLEGCRVRLGLAETPLDVHGRLVAHPTAVRENGEEVDVEAVLLKEGLARASGITPEGYPRLKGLQDQAKAAGVGMWGLPHPLKTGSPAGFSYCASGPGEVFHRADCPQALLIAPANFQTYQTLEDALATGRRPCRQCLSDLAAPAERK